MRSRLGDATLVEEVDAVRLLDRRQPVRDGNRRSALGGVVESSLDDLLRGRVEGRGGLVEKKHPRVSDERPGNSD